MPVMARDATARCITRPMIDQATIQRAVRMLLGAAPKGSKVILFGSHARGQARDCSDLDFLVIEPQVRGRLAEAARLDRALRGLRIAVDLLVTSEAIFEAWKNTPNSVLYEAAREGKVFREVA
jgi:predicted nucleotidyltransferase